MRVLTKMGIPVFVAPEKPAVAGVVEGIAVSKGVLSFTVKNSGNVHFLAQTVLAKALDASGNTSFEKKLDGWYVLAGGTRVWEVVLPKDICAKSKALSVEVRSAEINFNGRLDMPAAGCGP